MRRAADPEPNATPGTPLGQRFFRDLSDHAAELSRHGRACGLLPEAAPFLLECDAPDQLRLGSLHAFGERGHYLSVEPDDSNQDVPLLDLQPLEPGSYRAYAVLRRARRAFGPSVVIPGDDGAPLRRTRRYVARLVELRAVERRARVLPSGDCIDWLPVAEFERERQGGITRTVHDRTFHPPVLRLDAYTRANPLAKLAHRGIAWLGEPGEEPAHRHARAELVALRAIAERATPELAVLQVVRCLGALKAVHGTPEALPTCVLDAYTYEPHTFCEFLRQLGTWVDGVETFDPFPDVLDVGHEQYLRVAGEFRSRDGCWVWDAPHPGFVANGLLLYLPAATHAEIPPVWYGRGPQDLQAGARAPRPHGLPRGGTALEMAELKQQVDHAFMTVSVDKDRHRFNQLLGGGHALYRR